MDALDTKIIDLLNQVLKNELTAVNQYFLHARMLKDWGLHELAEHEYQESIDEMKHADSLVQRILFLDGLPNLQDLGKLYIGGDPCEVIECDLRLEVEAMEVLRPGIAMLEEQKDYVSRELLEEILESEESHVDWLETQKDLLQRVGEKHYLAQQIHERE